MKISRACWIMSRWTFFIDTENVLPSVPLPSFWQAYPWLTLSKTYCNSLIDPRKNLTGKECDLYLNVQQKRCERFHEPHGRTLFSLECRRGRKCELLLLNDPLCPGSQMTVAYIMVHVFVCEVNLRILFIREPPMQATPAKVVRNISLNRGS
jgi:hypothetical protein